MKFKRGQLVSLTVEAYGRTVPCIVLGLTAWSHHANKWYEVYVIEQQHIFSIAAQCLSPINPQGGS